jgi:hypothetical protein
MKMLGLGDLKPQFAMTETTVDCPVHGCSTVVQRRREGDGKPTHMFKCESCGIFVFPSTFEYVNDEDNLLWKAESDLTLLEQIKGSKAETHRLGRERSEDAVTWNVFRHFDRSDRLPAFLSHLTAEIPPEDCEVIYWSYSPMLGTPWSDLLKGRVEFGEAPSLTIAATGKRVSEPDIILLTHDSVIFVEAKFTSGNKTSGDAVRVNEILSNSKRYLSGGNEWYQTVFSSDYPTVVRDQKYELLRFWLLGSWMADRLGKKFVLANLVRKTKETNIEKEFGKHISQTESRRFVRWEWESLGPLLENLNDNGSLQLLTYLKNKTIGFGKDGRLPVARPKKAFRFD